MSRLVKADIVPEDDCMVTIDDDKYYTDVAEMLESLGDDVIVDGEPNLPAWCYATRRKTFDLNLFNCIESYMENNHHEEAYSELKQVDKLETLLNQWCALQTVSTFFIDYQRIIVIDPGRYARELVEATAWLEANPNG
ncbi:hypothetical protein [Phyllobacterium lublinensis]|uniref:hypothetical protein n=1 Tax=Phyllobacterium lublinensis TaxID=2875708 RepID=UPI001CCC9843|nr:hypothetical protein [Phyllobacterium sp. 2063]MBZ9655791.1 hypothetical protein [Phyllobacterium sp. 2063]